MFLFAAIFCFFSYGDVSAYILAIEYLCVDYNLIHCFTLTQCSWLKEIQEFWEYAAGHSSECFI